MDIDGEKTEGEGIERTVPVSVYGIPGQYRQRGPVNQRSLLLSPVLHLPNEKHHYAALTTTPLRAKTWEQESSESNGGKRDVCSYRRAQR